MLPATSTATPMLVADFGLVDYEKIFCPDPSTDGVFDLRGVNRDTGAIVVVRPDQYIAHVLPLGAYEALSDFFAGVLVQAQVDRGVRPTRPGISAES